MNKPWPELVSADTLIDSVLVHSLIVECEHPEVIATWAVDASLVALVDYLRAIRDGGGTLDDVLNQIGPV